MAKGKKKEKKEKVVQVVTNNEGIEKPIVTETDNVMDEKQIKEIIDKHIKKPEFLFVIKRDGKRKNIEMENLSIYEGKGWKKIAKIKRPAPEKTVLF